MKQRSLGCEVFEQRKLGERRVRNVARNGCDRFEALWLDVSL